ncbi:MAG TPA: ubiquinone/menaquinone biosynthesis methyltransferase [Gemmatimonadaceae bacterium]|nr:ubiquinone/menaquinone biosynthesis methyltransferase [Gemmatimonadaceae bacterium]
MTDLEHTERARAAASGAGDKRAYVRAMFSDIAPRYDLLNHLLSLNIDRRWRRRALRALEWERHADGVYLDLCAGTLDVAVELAAQPAFRGRVIGADFAIPMLQAGMPKARGTVVQAVAADALALPIADASCAGAIVAFGARNLSDLDAGLREVARVLRPGARFVILEFTTPPSAVIRRAYHLYFHHVLPRLGGWISGNPSAYRYLPESVAHFPSAPELGRRLGSAGFADVRWTMLTFGVAALHVGVRG